MPLFGNVREAWRNRPRWLGGRGRQQAMGQQQQQAPLGGQGGGAPEMRPVWEKIKKDETPEERKRRKEAQRVEQIRRFNEYQRQTGGKPLDQL